MDRPTTTILGVPISTLSMEKALELCAAQAAVGGGGYVCFANVHTVTESESNTALRDTLTRAFLAVADGVPLVWASRIRPPKIESRVCGPDFMKEFLEKYRDLPNGFIGGAPGQAEAMVARFGLSATCHSPPMRPYSRDAVLEDWRIFMEKNAARAIPRVVWVGLGAPKQELWMRTASEIAPDVLFMGVGAAFDFLTGTKKRAPIWMQRLGLEWFFRLLQEPRRLWRRYFTTNFRFLVLLVKDRISPRGVG